MARFYAVFDPTYVISGATSQKVYIGANAGTQSQLSESAAILRNGLIESRSQLSAQMYAQMDSANRDGSKGIIIPYDAITRTGGNFTFNNVYTSSIAGVVIPTTYYTRPSDAFISSSDPRLYATGDTGTILDSYYTAAGNAVDNVLRNKIQAEVGNTANYGPFSTNGGTVCTNKTIAKNLSIYYDQDLNYFEWDTYYVQDPLNQISHGGPFTGKASHDRTTDLTWTISATPSNIADAHGYFFWEIAKLIGPLPATTTYNLRNTDGAILVGAGAGNGKRWDISGSATFNMKIPANTLSAGDYKIQLYGYFQDATYPDECTSPCAGSPSYTGSNCYYTRFDTNIPPAEIAWLTMT